MEHPHTGGDSSETALELAARALDRGDSMLARNLAQSVLIAAKASGDLGSEGWALARLAHCDMVDARLARAIETSRRAARLFQRIGDAQGEAVALTTLANVCVLLGRHDEAVESAALCVRLCDLDGPRPEAVLAHDCLGMAYCWSGNFDRADASLATAVQIAHRCTPAVSTYQPAMNQAWVEAMRLVDERYQTGTMTSLARLEERVNGFRRLETGGSDLTSAGAVPIGRTNSLVMSGLLACWRGDMAAAHMLAELAVRSLGGTVTWLDPLVHWLLAEVAWASADWPTAESALGEMKELALAVEHEQLACDAHLLLAQLFEWQGKHGLAQAEHRALRVRERRMRSESVSSREAVVSWQLGARQSERHLQQALVASKQFERWSLEDALTGIANRRCFEQTLTERVQNAVAQGRLLTVAMIDVDQFKFVNDTFTHQVGDRVLKTLASVMTAAVRAYDLPARLAGDEFVVLFDDADNEVALDICERIRSAIATFDWDSIAEGLRVTVSIGVAEAVEGDTVETLLHRSDKSMYTVKASGLRTLY